MTGYSVRRSAAGLCGRRDECCALDRLLEGARAGQSSAFVIRGEAGVGKTALLDYVAERASGCRVARVSGVELELDFAFAGLLQLLAGPMLDRLEHLAGPQRDALRRAFGLMEGPSPEPFLVSPAGLNLLSHVAEERPLVCLVDDVQWLDRESVAVLSFIVRRLAASPPSRSRCCSGYASRVQNESSTVCGNSYSRNSTTPTPADSWTRRSPEGSAIRCASGLRPKPSGCERDCAGR